MRARPPSVRSAALALALLALQLVALAAAAPLPIHLRWLEAVAPPAVVGRALNAYFQAIPRELCAMGPDSIANLPPVATNQICPLKAVSRIEGIVPSLDHDAKIDQVAGNPITLGGALMLLAADNVTQAGDLQKQICKRLLYPRKYCNFTSGDHVGPLFHRLSVDTTDAVGQWILEMAAPAAAAPLGASLTGLPDAMCRMPAGALGKIPAEMRYELCPSDVSLMPVMTMFVLGKTGSTTLHAKLCDIMKRQEEACKGGKYTMDFETEDRIEEINARSNKLISSLAPRLTLPTIALPDIASAAAKGPAAALSDWWVNQTMPILRRSTITALIPPNLQPPAAALLDRLPASICGLTLPDIAKLPWMFKREVCPLGGLLKPRGNGSAEAGLQSWALTLAEVSMGAAARNSSAGRARVDDWVARMCSVMYAPEVACRANTTNEAGAAPLPNATDLAVARIADDYKPISVKLLGAALAAMPPAMRSQLTDGLAGQVGYAPQLVNALPKEARGVLLRGLCYVATPVATLQVDDDAPLLSHVAAGKAYTNEARDLLGLLIGENKAAALVDALCAAAPPPPPPGAVAKVAQGLRAGLRSGLGMLASGYGAAQGVASKVQKFRALLPQQAPHLQKVLGDASGVAQGVLGGLLPRQR